MTAGSGRAGRPPHHGHPDATEARGPRIGLFGPFDRHRLGDRLALRALRAEFRRRGAHVEALAPSVRPSPLDDGEPLLQAPVPLRFGPTGPGPTRELKELLSRYDQLVLVRGDEPFPPEVHVEGVWVLEEAVLAGLAPRLLTGGVGERRLSFLKTVGWYPREGPAVLVGISGTRAENHGFCEALGGLCARLSREERADAAVVVARVDGELGHAPLAAALSEAVPRLFSLVPEASLEDLLAALAASAVVVTDDPVAAEVARVCGSPVVKASPDALRAASRARAPLVLGGVGEGSPRGARPPLATHELEGRLDAIVEAAQKRAGERAGLSLPSAPELREELRLLRALVRERDRQLAAERARFADVVTDLRLANRELEERVRTLREQASALVASLERAREAEASARLAALEKERDRLASELAALYATRTLRYSAGARRLYGRLRRGLGRLRAHGEPPGRARARAASGGGEGA